MESQLFLVEQYDHSGTGPDGPVPALAEPVRVVTAFHLAADQVVLALVEGPDAATVAAAAAEAGWPVDRILPAVPLTALGVGQS
jgi:hypothetical protein